MMAKQQLYGGEKMYKCMKCGHLFTKVFALFSPKCPLCGSRWVTKMPTAC